MALFRGRKKTKLFMVTLLIITMIMTYGIPLSVYAADDTNGSRNPPVEGLIDQPEQTQQADQPQESDQPLASELTAYVVEYETADGTELLPDKVVEEQTIGAEVVENAVEVENYEVDETSKILTLDAADNTITFIYTLIESKGPPVVASEGAIKEEVTSDGAIEEEIGGPGEMPAVNYPEPNDPDSLGDAVSDVDDNGFYYPSTKSLLKSVSLMSAISSTFEWPAAGAINLTKSAVPVSGSDTQWKVTLTIEGKDIQSSSDVVLVIDKSRSMADNSKMDNTKAAAKAFVNQLLIPGGNTRIAMVSFAGSTELATGFYGYADKQALIDYIEGLSANGGTNIQSGIHQAQIILDTSTALNKYMVLLGDGEPTYSYAVTAASGIDVSYHWYGGKYSDKYWYPEFDLSKAEITNVNYDSIVGAGNNYGLIYNGYYNSYDFSFEMEVKPTTNPNGEPYTGSSGTFHTGFPENNGTPTIYEAGLAKAKGIKIYSIGLSAGTNGDYVLNQCQDQGYYALSGSDLSSLSTVFSKIACSIVYAATNGVVTDPLGDMFNYVSGITVSQGTYELSSDSRTITWKVGNVVEGNPATMSYIVQIKSGANADTMYPTNGSTTFVYNDVYGGSTSKNFEIPNVSIGGGSILIKGYLVNDAGQPINSIGTVVERPDLAQELYSSSYPGSPLAYNNSYPVSEPGYSGYQYVVYTWNSTTGSAATVPVYLTSDAPTQTVWFGYKLISTATITYLAGPNGNISGDTEQTVLKGGSTTPVTATPDKGYHFAGWDDDNTNATRNESNVTADATYTANFEANEVNYTVNYLEKGTDKVLKAAETKSGTFGTSVTEDAADIEGYTVVESPLTITSLAAEENVITFYYTASTGTPYTIITYLQENGAYPEVGTSEVKNDGVTGQKKNITPGGITGYIFDEEAQNILSATINGDGETVFKLYYKKIYTVSYVPGSNGTLSGTAIYTAYYGDSFPTVPTPVAASGYHFDSWSPVLPGSEVTVTGNVTFTAIFASNGGGNGGGDGGGDGGGHSHKATLASLNMEDHIAYIQGYPDDTVRPEGNITREEVAAVFYRLLDSTYRDSIRTSLENFNDVEADRWSTKHIATLSNGKIITGYPDGGFRPGEYITRAELAAIAARFDDLSVPDENKFTDISGHWAEEYIVSAAEKGWVSGYPDSTFRPDQYITRAEFVTLVNNVLNRKVTLEEILTDAKRFSDLEEGKWYYEAMEEAINSHNYERKTNGTENWTDIASPSIEM